MEARTKIGCTPVTEGLTIEFYISSMDESGREEQWGHTLEEAEARRAFEQAKESEYDMHLYVSLVKNHGSDEPELIDDEVLESFNDE